MSEQCIQLRSLACIVVSLAKILELVPRLMEEADVTLSFLFLWPKSGV